VSTNVIVMFKSKPEKVAAFAALMAAVKNELPKVEGCIAVRIFNDRHNPCEFVLVETWASEAAHKQHIDRVVSSGGWDHIASHLADGPISSYYDAV
jgi:quinol monooxygenase YgiN